MFRPLRQLVPWLLALAAPVAWADDDLSSLVKPQPGLLVLTNGQVLAGEITRAGDQYYLTLSTGEITVRATDVELQCRDLDEAYAHKRAKIAPEQVTEHLKLAEWCLRQGLAASAAREVSDAARYAPADPRVTALSRRIVLASQEPAAPIENVDTKRSATLAELERVVRDLPPGVAATFTSTIQPLLMNHCGTAACHGAQRTNDFALVRIGGSRAPSRRLTVRHLGNTLDQIDRQQPETSPLIVQPLGLDAEHAHPVVFTDPNGVAYRQLVDWVRAASGVKAEDDAAMLSDATPPDAPLLGRGSPTVRRGAAGAAQAHQAGREPTIAASHQQGEHTLRQPMSRSAAERQAQIERGYDPFDPAPLNRRNFPQGRSADAPPAPLPESSGSEIPDAPR